MFVRQAKEWMTGDWDCSWPAPFPYKYGNIDAFFLKRIFPEISENIELLLGLKKEYLENIEWFISIKCPLSNIYVFRVKS